MVRAYWTACSGRRPRGPARPRAGAAVPNDVLGLRAACGGGESVATARGVHLPLLDLRAAEFTAAHNL
ncbi:MULTISPECIES: hypothetical protein [unclassified Streptomyces]|uniref:hypothetical protein n=1 Tax=unclassified Streptomyces TaxID=2593676 RepID=UPI002ED15B04|nr:hypothetical protein OH827_00410 [Streptomyces sp. NBC_00891]WSY03577.1 hypothetical protein OG464_00410 [Streptomyces sp. NBC_00890]WSZ05204.1 hypothetical protein OG704_00410 [Streptomyces sp. NBC_00869]WSZ27301.1 hypothetical protein OG498_33155 [Streptomyces sp. NBC_00870]